MFFQFFQFHRFSPCEFGAHYFRRGTLYHKTALVGTAQKNGSPQKKSRKRESVEGKIAVLVRPLFGEPQQVLFAALLFMAQCVMGDEFQDAQAACSLKRAIGHAVQRAMQLGVDQQSRACRRTQGGVFVHG